MVNSIADSAVDLYHHLLYCSQPICFVSFHSGTIFVYVNRGVHIVCPDIWQNWSVSILEID